ncbi:SurA N-terminal domain-containing protein [Sphingomonas sp. PL-96]|uniref:peptidylprolyl isomerase n=1 Tax=Sphingomonas sp. PL-96 TaxID=2887201 RepID=UPI001E330148|nr:peptidylprolyl isomerase [Sphingomonas sp. PL-96]MCC2976464.1 SurA N-terminal domain-containing protein [Sphingomonas sp. PL-96]
MLANVRRLLNSTIGKVVALAFLVVIALAFAAGDISGLRSGGASSDVVAKVGGTAVHDAELTKQVQQQLEATRQRNPNVDIAQLVAAGGVENVLQQLVTSIALEQYAQKAGMAVNSKLVDGQIASIPAFQGFTGKFDQATFERAIAQRGMTPAGLREAIGRDMLSNWLISPTIGASQLPEQIAVPYASLLLEKRAGQIALIPTAAVPQGNPPTDAELTAFYTRNRARYTVPERRVIRYALVSANSVAASAAPTDAEIAQAYRAAGSRFAASQRRTVRQVVLADQNAANQLAARVKGGTAIDAAARAAGLEASNFSDQNKAGLVAQTNQAIADAAFAAGEGAVIGPVRSPLGWHVLRVEKVTQIPGKTLEQARPELVAELSRSKAASALNAAQERIDGAINDGATFAEVVSEAKLAAQSTAAVTKAGTSPDQPNTPADPALARVVEAGFAAEQGDAPQIVQTEEDGSFAVVGVDRVMPAAPRPLAQVREDVQKAFLAERGQQAARKAAAAILAKVNGGTPLAQAVSASGLKVPAPTPLAATRAQLAAQQGQVPPPVELMFAMAPKKARLIAAPNNGGWFVVYLDSITPGDASGDKRAVSSARAGLSQIVGQEYAEQFAEAVRRSVGVTKNDAAVARVRTTLAPQGSAAAN